MNESVLIGRAEKFLGRIRQKTVNADNINSLESFLEIHSYLKDNLQELQDLRETMEIKGYKAPYRSIMKYGPIPSSERMAEDMQDVSRHTQHFRMRAAAKKNILDRVKSSIASHKIAIGNLEEFSTIRCSSCQQKFSGHDLSLAISHRCSCGSPSFELELNPHGVYRLEIIKYLPLSGEYMVKMAELSLLGREAFRKMVKILKQEKRGIVKTLSLVVKVFEDGRWVRKRTNIDAAGQLDYEKEVRKKYGSNARIEFLQFHRKKPSIINDKHVQTALSLAYVKFAENEAKKFFKPVLERSANNMEKLEIYDQNHKNAAVIANKIEEDPEQRKNLREELLNQKLIEKGLMDEKGSPDKELQHDLQVRSKLEKDLLVDLPRTLILWDIIKYYLSTSHDRRSKSSGPFPNLRPHLDKIQINAFGDFQEEVVNILKEYSGEKIEYIPHIKKVLSKKFEMENRIRGLHVKINPPASGAAILKMVGNLSLEESARIFCVSPAEVQAEENKFGTFQRPTTRKAQRFLELIKE
jgi:uncharacterized protein